MALNPEEQRKIRPKNDYQSMVNISRTWLTWRVETGSAPHVESYEVTAKIKTITGPPPTYTLDHKIRIDLPQNYPLGSAPTITYLGATKPFHPNWWTSGKWCYGSWLVHESLGQHLVRMLPTLQYDTQITNELSPANRDAAAWYVQSKNKGWFPCDKHQCLIQRAVAQISLSPRRLFE